MFTKRNNYPVVYLLLIAFIFILLKLYHRTADTDDLLFLLSPIAKIVEVATGVSATYIPGSGYLYEHLGIIIDKSCSGFNFACLCFLIIYLPALKYLTGTRKRLLAIPVALLFSFLLTILANSSRILLSISIRTSTKRITEILPNWLHFAEGVFVYLFFLIVIYLLTNLILTQQTQSHEKHT